MFNINLFSARLKEARRAAGITQKEIGYELGMLQTAYSRFERGKYQFNYEQLFYISKRLEVSIDYLLGVSEF